MLKVFGALCAIGIVIVLIAYAAGGFDSGADPPEEQATMAVVQAALVIGLICWTVSFFIKRR